MGNRAPYDLADFPDRNWTGTPTENTRRQETSRRFHDLMDAAMMVSFHKYGAVALGYPERVDALKSLQMRLNAYFDGKRNPDYRMGDGAPEYLVAPGNVEYLVDVANFAMIEFMHPRHPEAYFKSTDSDGSPGRVAVNTELYDKPNQMRNENIATSEGVL